MAIAFVAMDLVEGETLRAGRAAAGVDGGRA
jgi:hypothetical protein